MRAMNALLFALLAFASAPPAPQPAAASALLQEGEVDPFLAAYREHGDARDSEALTRMWMENPGRVLPTFDSDLEGSLSLVESGPTYGRDGTLVEPDEETARRIETLEQRAVFAARVAAELLDRPLLLDYAVSFAGWNRDQQVQFREGQKAFGMAGQALREGDLETAAQHAQRCTELAEPLGDWWGTAMGRSMSAQVALSREDHGTALLEAARARTIHHGLGLTSSEAGNLLVLGEAALALGRRERAAEAARAGLALSPEGARHRAALEDLAGRCE